MSTLALSLHGGRPEAVAVGVSVCRWASDAGHVVVTSPSEGEILVAAGAPSVGLDGPDVAVDLVVAIGGDGTMLRATRRAVAADADVLGINLGQLGYLAEIEPGGWEAALVGYFAGHHQLTERLLVASSITVGAPGLGDATVVFPPALNEVVIEKQALGRTVRLGVSIDGEFFTSYVADGLIIASPTGSTAYALSARGPVVAPTLRALLLTPVSPHSLFDRSLVLEPTSTVDVAVMGDRSAGLAVDGEHLSMLEPGTTVSVTADHRPARIVSFRARDFHKILKAKFGLSDR